MYQRTPPLPGLTSGSARITTKMNDTGQQRSLASNDQRRQAGVLP